jgi:TolB-like protein/lipopolysaccharide biosynthesis regulator YciM
MYTDIEGYTALTQTNEPLAMELLQKHRELVRAVLPKHSGREIKTMGDAFLLEFASALQATECAVEIQRTHHEHNANARDKLSVRIGIHVGDVIHQRGDVYGDAVNIASRIEQLAQGGGICISEQVYDQVHNKVPYRLTKLQPTKLKNVSFPTDVYQLEAREEKMQHEAGYDAHRLAILPLTNISPDPKDEYFADGMTEELISTISGISELNVISRTSVMGYKGTGKRVADIARELEVGTVLEGSVRKAENMIRVTVQLIDANRDGHLWSQSYDGELKSIFTLQSDIASKVAGALKVKLIPVEAKQLEKAPTTSPEAYTLYLRGRQLLNEGTDSSLRQALELFTKATKLDPLFARAYIAIGDCYALLGIRSYVSFDEAISGMKSAAKKALEIDPKLAEGHYLLARVACGEDDHIKDGEEAQKAVELNPNLAQAQAMLGTVMGTNGYPKQATRLLETAISLDPLSGELIRFLGNMYAYTGKTKEALDFLTKCLSIAPVPASQALATLYLTERDFEKAEKEIISLEARLPKDFSVISLRGFLSALKRDRDATMKVIERLEKSFSGGATVRRNIGYMRYFLGDTEAFFEAMMRAAEEHVLDPFVLRYSPLFEKARRDPRYRQVMIKSGLDPEIKE